MATITFTAADAEFDNDALAQGTEVRSRSNDIQTFLEGNNLEPTDNIKMTASYPWTGRHSWTVSDASNDNCLVTVQAVMSAAKYGLKVISAAAQINSALVHHELSHASSTVSILELVNAGSGSASKVTQSGNNAAYEGICDQATITADVYKATQSGTGSLLGGTLRSLASLTAVLKATAITAPVTIDNTDTETVVLTTTLPANFLKVGTTIRGRIYGTIATPGASLADARMYVKYGGTAGTELLDSGAVTLGNSLVNSLVTLEFTLTCMTIGATGTIEAQGVLQWGSNTAPAARGMGTAGSGATNAAAITIDTTAEKALVVTFDWSAAGAGHTTVIRAGHLEILP